ncbi:general stress protein [Pontibacillus halophilus JSM 076056 = DSM 19796]|uniref:General stress protein n=1 Tax=Pontibacillus halophilus JSM 076056 = DSM 19796 TaxID=1385510 RepID=A0A0A5GD27_9BACI|nr:general stress protein [Pontibacillus halophilus JSM 076056 = DSM 19796]
MKDLEKRLIYLFTGEFISLVTFVYIYTYYNVNSNNSITLLFVFVLLVFILLQASFYWFIKWRRMKTKKVFVPRLNKLLIIFNNMNLIFIGIAPALFIIEIISSNKLFSSSFFLTLFIYIFVIIEYINYYHIQLTNYKNGRGKRPSMYKEIFKV